MKWNGYATGVKKRDIPLLAFCRGANANVYDSSRSFLGGTSILWGFDSDHLDKMNQSRKMGLPWFHLDHAYFKRGYEHGNFRVNYCHFHQTRTLDLPGDRMELAKKRLEDWKTTGSSVVVILPSDRVLTTIRNWRGEPKSGVDWSKDVTNKLRRHTDRQIVVKEKGPGLDGYLRGAWAVVSLSSVAEVEAAVKGIPVFTSEDSPASQVSEKDLSKIETPIYPDREAWLRTLSYSQFHSSEMGSGKAASILKDIYELLDTPDIR